LAVNILSGLKLIASSVSMPQLQTVNSLSIASRLPLNLTFPELASANRLILASIGRLVTISMNFLLKLNLTIASLYHPCSMSITCPSQVPQIPRSLYQHSQMRLRSTSVAISLSASFQPHILNHIIQVTG
jgi:hypothetical protein